MVKNIKTMLVLSLLITLFFSCTKDVEPALPEEPETEITDTAEPEEETSKKPENKPSGEQSTKPETGQQQAFEMGTGSGDLNIDGSHPSLQGKTLILIKAGSYNNLSIKNFKGTASNPIVIKNGGQVYIKSEMDISNVTQVVIAGDQDKSIPYGFNFHNIQYRAIFLRDRINGLTLKNMSFKNVNDYTIFSTEQDRNYDGSIASRTEGLKILNSRFDNTGSIAFFGNFENGADKGFVNNLEIAYNIFENSSAGSALFANNVQNYDIHHNTLNNYNTQNNNHNGIFHMIGAGKFHHNKFTNFQGNMIRAWLFTRTGNPVDVEIYNNIAYNTRKYGAFELQGFDHYIRQGKSTYANAKVYNNTAGRLNTSKDWEGVMLDLYNYGGTLEYYNNLGFEMNGSQNAINNGMLNNMSSVKILKNSNNKYVSKAADAVVDVNNLVSKHQGIGATKL